MTRAPGVRHAGDTRKTDPTRRLMDDGVDDGSLELLDVAQAAKYLSTPVRFIRRLVAQRRIRFYKVGRYVRIDKSDLDTFVVDGRVDAFHDAR